MRYSIPLLNNTNIKEAEKIVEIIEKKVHDNITSEILMSLYHFTNLVIHFYKENLI